MNVAESTPVGVCFESVIKQLRSAELPDFDRGKFNANVEAAKDALQKLNVDLQSVFRGGGTVMAPKERAARADALYKQTLETAERLLLLTAECRRALSRGIDVTAAVEDLDRSVTEVQNTATEIQTKNDAFKVKFHINEQSSN